MRNSKFDFTKCCLEYMEDLFDEIDDLDEELSSTKADYQQLDGRFNAVDEMYHKLRDENEELRKTNESYLKALRSANTCVDNLNDKIGAIRKIIIDNIICGVDAEGNHEMFVTVDEINKEFTKLCDLLDITEDDYCEHI